MTRHDNKKNAVIRKLYLEDKANRGDISIDNFLELAQLYFFDQEYQKVIDTTSRALSVATEATDKAAIFYNMALGYYGLQQLHEAAGYFQKSLDIASLLDDSYFKIEIMGANHYYLRWCFYNEREKFEEHAQKARELYETLVNKYPDGDTVDIAYESLGYLYIDLSAFKKAIEYFNKALDKSVSNDHRQSCYLGISECLKHLGDNAGADKYSKMAAQSTIEGYT
jgi:tetratricopeptide (TPR) repeat protein